MSKRRAAARAKRDNVYELQQALESNGRAFREGPKRKNWSKHDLKYIKAKTYPQGEMIRMYIEGQNIIAHGSAGTGKTFIGLYLAINDLLDHESEIDKIIIIRSAVPTREQGFLPGTEEEKAAAYERPYAPMFQQLLGRENTYEDMKEAGKVEFETTSFLRGVTWENAVVVVDECQSMTFHEINTVMTRLGSNSRIILCGDIPQTDLTKKHETSGMEKALRIFDQMPQFTSVRFTRDDIVRSDLVKSWIIAAEEDDAKHG